MSNKDVYIFYSGATDVTGKKLQETLDIVGGSVVPKTDKRVIIGWGAKTKDSLHFKAGVTVLNHPDRIRDNRNKLRTLETLKKAKVAVADFADADKVKDALKKGTLSFPLIGRTKFHQGGKEFWLCLTQGQLDDAKTKGAQYFQGYIPIKDEYRLHIFGDSLLYAAKKVQRDNMAEAFEEQFGEKIGNAAEKGKKELDKNTMKFVLGQVANKVQPSADMIIRSNTRGWKFSHVKTVPNGLLEEAKKALKAVGLDFGGVDCCVDEDGKIWIIEINSGPGLEGSTFEVYVKAFKDKIGEILNPKAKKEEKPTMVKKDTVDKPGPATKGNGSVKAELKQKAELLNDMIAAADETEATMLKGLFGKMFGGK